MTAACRRGGLGTGSGSLAASVNPSSDVSGGIKAASAADVPRAVPGACRDLVNTPPVPGRSEELGAGPSSGGCGRLRVNCTGGGGSGGGAGSDPVHEDVLLLLPLNAGGRTRVPAAPGGRAQGMPVPLPAPSPVFASLLDEASAALAMDVLGWAACEGKPVSG